MKVAKLILTYNNHDLTKKLLNTFPDAIVVDNGSDVPVDYTDHVIRFDSNLGFTKGWNEALSSIIDSYDAFWLMNNDIETEPVCFDKLVWALENKPRLGIVSPFCNSPHKIMHRNTPNSLRYVPFVEFVAPMIRREVLKDVGMFDETFSKGWGVEYDYCWRARRNGYSVGVFDLVGIKHLEHKTIDNLGRADYFLEASKEMNSGLVAKYGPFWERDINTMIALTMVVCNEEKRLPEFFYKQAYLFDEISVAVQASEDKSLEICKRYADTVIATPCTGYCESDRSIVSLSTLSDWQLCLDPDEYLTPEFVAEYRQLVHKGKLGYRLTRRLIEDGEFRFEGDRHHRFYHRSNVKFLNELHTEPQANSWDKVGELPYTSIDHIKTLQETLDDEFRYEDVIERLYKNSSTYEAKKKLNIHISGMENK